MVTFAAEAFAVTLTSGAATVIVTTGAAVVGAAVGTTAGAWFVQPAKQIATNSNTTRVEVNLMYTSLLILTPG